MKKAIFSLFILCFSLMFLVGCNSSKTPQAIQLQVTTAIEPEYDNIQILGNFIIAEKGDRSAIYSFDGTTYHLIVPSGTYVTTPNYINFSVGNTLSVYTKEYDDDGDIIIKNGLIDIHGNIVVPLQDVMKCDILETLNPTNPTFYIQRNSTTKITYFYDGNGDCIAKLPNPTNEFASIAQKGDQIVTYFSSTQHDSNATTNLFDKNGNKILPVDYKYLSAFGDYFIAQSLDGFYGVLDWNGNTIIPFEYSFLGSSDYSNSRNTWMEAKHNNSEPGYFLLNINGEKLLEGCGYSDLKLLPDGNIQVEQNNLYGVVTPENQVLLELKADPYIHVFEYQNEFYVNSTESSKYHSNFKTVTFYDNNYAPINTFPNLKPYLFLEQSGQYIIQNENNNMSIFNHVGQQLIPFDYQKLLPLKNSYCLAKKNNEYCFINLDTQEIILSGFDSANLNDEIIQLTKNGQKFFYNYNCNPIDITYDSNKIANFLLRDNSKGMNADISKDGANSVRKNDEYIDNQDGTKNMIVVIESNTGKKGIALIPSMN